MTRFYLVLALIAGFSFSSTSQVNPHAIGLRGGLGNLGYGGEVSYQHGFGDANRLELDLGWRGNNGSNGYRHTYISGIYHWVWNIEGGLNWFAGVGGQLGFHNYKYSSNEDGITLAVGGQIGIEYDFNEHGVPIQLGLDTRPMWRFIGNNNGNGFGYGGALSVRYTF